MIFAAEILHLGVGLGVRPQREKEGLAFAVEPHSLFPQGVVQVVSPLFAWLQFRSHDSGKPAYVEAAVFGTGMGAEFLSFLLFEPLDDDSHATCLLRRPAHDVAHFHLVEHLEGGDERQILIVGDYSLQWFAVGVKDVQGGRSCCFHSRCSF